jgi:hypothetical protein
MNLDVEGTCFQVYLSICTQRLGKRAKTGPCVETGTRDLQNKEDKVKVKVASLCSLLTECHAMKAY